MDTTKISIDEIQRYLVAKQKKKEYNRRYQQSHKPYFAKYQRDRRVKLLENPETPDTASPPPVTAPPPPDTASPSPDTARAEEEALRLFNATAVFFNPRAPYRGTLPSDN